MTIEAFDFSSEVHMPAICKIERLDRGLRIEVLVEGRLCFGWEEPLEEDDRLGSNVEEPEEIEVEDIQDAEYAVLEYPAGLPEGYCVYTFYRGKGSERKPLKSVLYGPHGIVGTFPNPNAAVIVAVNDNDLHGPRQTKPPGM